MAPQNEDVAFPGKESTPESVEDVLQGIAERNSGSDLGRLAQLLLDAAKGDLQVTDTFTETGGDAATDTFTETVSDPNLGPEPSTTPAPDVTPGGPGAGSVPTPPDHTPAPDNTAGA